MKKFVLLIFIVAFALSQELFAKGKKVQEVSFGEMDLKGTVRNPDGAFLVQKKGIRFLPLYQVQKNFDHKIRESVQYMK